MIPEFDEQGLLPEGIHSATWEEVITHFGGNERRRQLLSGLSEALGLLKSAGCRRVYIDGSFVTSKERPNDIDVCWDIDGVDADALDPVFFEFGNGRAAQKARFGAEFFPAQVPEGITGKVFLDFFQVDRETGEAKGIIELFLDDG
ncbi:MAG TPA: hypothetical protein VJQ56_00105 [Blastocatellia bacterium]|nr:hypothetical protein [Blastocatellia bacterium]